MYWKKILKYCPLEALLASEKEAIVYLTKRDLMDIEVSPVSYLWNLPESGQILKKMKSEGYWKSLTKNRVKAPAVNYDLFETFKQFSKLVEMYGLNRSHESIAKAAEYLFSCQTDEGDIRGIIGNQYAPYYTGLILSHLINAGYKNDERVDKAFDWLTDMRQNDGGWVIGSPGCFGEYSRQEYNILTTHNVETKRDFDWTKPFSHSGTGIVIRAFAVHEKYCKTDVAQKAATLLKSQFFKKDNYNSYKASDNWVNFKYPFFWTDLVSAMDSISRIAPSVSDKDISKAVEWFIDNQMENGLWKNTYSRIHKNISNNKTYEIQLWVTLSICRILKRIIK